VAELVVTEPAGAFSASSLLIPGKRDLSFNETTLHIVCTNTWTRGKFLPQGEKKKYPHLPVW
jgi:hypothetical protein